MVGPVVLFLLAPLAGILLGTSRSFEIGKLQKIVSFITATILVLFTADAFAIFIVLGRPHDSLPIVLAVPFIFVYERAPTIFFMLFLHGGWAWGVLIRRSIGRFVKKQRDS